MCHAFYFTWLVWSYMKVHLKACHMFPQHLQSLLPVQSTHLFLSWHIQWKPFPLTPSHSVTETPPLLEDAFVHHPINEFLPFYFNGFLLLTSFMKPYFFFLMIIAELSIIHFLDIPVWP